MAQGVTGLRGYLRAQTRVAHQRLDDAMCAIGWQSSESYNRFLQVQFAARLPIEKWVLGHCPVALKAPAQIHLIESDLREMGTVPAASTRRRFTLPVAADPIGAVWALAGSSLGNRAIARSLQRVIGGEALPTRFLDDPAMNGFWKSLLPRLSAEPDEGQTQRACDGALAVFDHFFDTVCDIRRKEAA